MPKLRSYLKYILLVLAIGFIMISGATITGASFWSSITDIFTKEEISHTCNLEDSNCIEEEIISEGWSRTACESFELAGLRINITPKQDYLACIATDITLSDAQIEQELSENSIALASKLALKRIKMFCCDNALCKEEYTIRVYSLVPYLNSQEFDALEAKIVSKVSCAENAEIV